MRKLLLIILLFTIFSAIATGQTTSESDGFDLKQKLKTEEFQLGLLVQTLGIFSFEDDNFLGGRQYQLGATRLDIKGQLKSNFIYRFQFDLTKSPSIIDAQVGYKFSKKFQIVAGSFKPFLSAALDPSPANLDFVHRAQLVGAMMNTREIGITALGEVGKLNYRFGMYNGYGLQTTNDNRFMYIARLGYIESIGNGEIEFGLNGALNNSRMESVAKTGLISTEGRTIYGAFARYNSMNWFGTVEFMQSQFERSDINLDEIITGFYTTVGHKITAIDELLVRWDHLSYDVRESTSQRISFGWNRQFSDLIRFKMNVVGNINKDADNQFGAVAALQFAF